MRRLRRMQEGMQQQGTDEVFERLFRAEYAGLVRVVSRFLDVDLAEDVVQECFAKLHRRLPLDPAYSRNLLYRIAINAALSTRRSELRRVVREQNPPAVEAEMPEDLVFRQETREKVRRVLDRLPNAQAAALMLRYSGYSYKDMADFLNLSVSNVGVLLHRAEIAFEKEFERVTPA
jgi:RNA polymerase sigma factor (sigma-70 family)